MVSDSGEEEAGAPPPSPRAGVAVRGQVVWSGPEPDIADCIALVRNAAGGITLRAVAHPNRLRRHPREGGVAEALVWLEPVSSHGDASASEADVGKRKRLSPGGSGASPAWPAVRLRLDEQAILVEQAGRCGRLGIVAPEAEITVVGSGDTFHALAGRGAAFFRWTVPVGCSPRVQPLPPLRRQATPRHWAEPLPPADAPDTPLPIIELFDDAHRYWTRAYILVCDHPYAAVTDEQGYFQWSEVPSGEWHVIVWHPSWTVRRQERDPESTQVVRQFFTAPQVRRVPLSLPSSAEDRPLPPLRIDLSDVPNR